MQDSREQVINTTDKNPDTIARSELKARLAQVLSRSIVEDRLLVPLPDDLHGEWVPDDEVEIARKQALGFEFNTTHGIGNKLHDDGTGRIKVGDLVHMTIPKIQKEVIDELVREKFLELHGPRKIEEKEFKSSVEAKSRTGPVIDQSKDTKVNAKQIVDSLPKQ